MKFANLKALLVKSFEEDINPTKNVAVSSTNKLVKILAGHGWDAKRHTAHEPNPSDDVGPVRPSPDPCNTQFRLAGLAQPWIPSMLRALHSGFSPRPDDGVGFWVVAIVTEQWCWAGRTVS